MIGVPFSNETKLTCDGEQAAYISQENLSRALTILILPLVLSYKWMHKFSIKYKNNSTLSWFPVKDINISDISYKIQNRK